MSSNWVTFEVKVDIHVFTETARVIIPVCLRVTERFQNDV